MAASSVVLAALLLAEHSTVCCLLCACYQFCCGQEAGAAAAEPGSRLGETGEEFTRQISARLRRSIGLPAQRPEREDPSKQLQLQRDEANLHAAAQSAAAD